MTLTCFYCGTEFEPRTVTADSPEEARARLQRMARFPCCCSTQCLDTACEIQSHDTCPDGRKHDWRFDGHVCGHGDEGRRIWGDRLFKTGECRRCGVFYLLEA